MPLHSPNLEMQGEGDRHIQDITNIAVSLCSVRKEYARDHNSLAPVASLPNELLTAIFEAGCENIPSSSPASLPFEILVSHITQHWRTVSHCSPRLWTRIFIDTTRSSYLTLAADYIHRSGALPLDIDINGTWRRQGQIIFRSNLRSVFHIIFNEVKRWHQIRIDSDTSTDLQCFFDELPSYAPILHSLEIRFYGLEDRVAAMNAIEPTTPRRIFIGGAPLLSSINLLGVTLQSCLPPLAALTSLRYHRPIYLIETIKMCGIFADLSALTHLVFNSTNFNGWPEALNIELPALCSLYLRVMWDYDKVLNTITAPRLDTLYLGNVDGAEMDRITSLFIHSAPERHKFPLLRSLTVQPYQESHFRVPKWNAVMAAFPALTNFTLLSHKIKHFLLALREPLSIPWPSLHTLSLPKAPSTFWFRIISTIQERKDAGCPLHTVKLPRAIVDGRSTHLQGITEVIQFSSGNDVGCGVEWLGDDEDEDSDDWDSDQESEAYMDGF